MGGGKYRPPDLQIIFTGFNKHESNDISPGGDCGTSERAKPEAVDTSTNLVNSASSFHHNDPRI